MKFTPTPLEGVVEVVLEPIEDERGFFARTWCAEEFARFGLDRRLEQCSISHNRKRGILRGMHLQREPSAEAKLVRCTRGSIYDVALDLRRDSATYRRWFAIELSAGGRSMLYLPEGVAHGFQTLADDTEVFYQISRSHHPDDAWGVRWNDPAFGIDWPVDEPILSVRDASYPDYE
ncbi:MAG: dTDP-4-dehydrorhamnose 3,5-epimerase [Acidobacteriota bacterium]